MVIVILGKFPGAQQLMILQRLPTVLDRIKGGVEDDAVGVQMRVKRPRGVVGEQSGGKIAGETFFPDTTCPNAGGGKFLKFPERSFDRPPMRRQYPFVFTEESND